MNCSLEMHLKIIFHDNILSIVKQRIITNQKINVKKHIIILL